MGQWQKIWRYALSWVADFSEYQAMGFTARTFNNDFILSKEFNQLGLRLSIYQGIEPHNPKFNEIVDFEIPDACLVIEGIASYPQLRSMIGVHFERVEVRSDLLFAYSRQLELDDHKMKQAVILVDEAIRALGRQSAP